MYQVGQINRINGLIIPIGLITDKWNYASEDPDYYGLIQTLRPGGINSLFPLSRPTLQKGAAQKILVKYFILFSTTFKIFTIN